MGSGLISIAMTGINAAQTGLLTTSNNIANLSTEGYTRQRTVQASNPTVMTGAGGIGQGTHVVTVERMYSEALTKQVLNAQAKVSALDTYYAQISQIDNMLADKEAGLTPVMQEFFDAVQAVASNPSSLSARQSMVSASESMVSGFQSIYSRLGELEDGVNSQISSVVNSINTYTKQIGEINQKIISASALNGQPANDLLDKRDQLVAELNDLVKVTVTVNDDSSYNVFVGSGQQLVVGSRVTEMAAKPSAADPSRIVVGLVGATGNVQELPESLISGGKLGGLLSFRTDALDTSFNQLGLMATSLSQTFNAQNALGQDLLGNVAGGASFVANYFSVTPPTVIGNPATAPLLSVTLDPPLNNGTNFYTNLTASDYRLSSDGTNLTLTRLSDGTTWTDPTLAGMNNQLASDPQGFTLSTNAGVFAAGDSYIIQPTRDAARLFAVDARVSADPRLIAAGLSPVVASNVSTNQGNAAVTAISFASGYSVGSPALSIQYAGGNLTGFPAGNVTVTSGASSVTYVTPSSIPYTPGATIAINSTAAAPAWSGVSVVLDGNPVNGDTFSLTGNITGVEDGRNVVKLGNLQTQNTVLGASATFQDNYAGFVNDIGNKTAAAEISSMAQTSLLSQAVAARESVSGVNRDEEAAKLIEYQQAYQASAKVLEIASNLFDTLLSLGR